MGDKIHDCSEFYDCDGSIGECPNRAMIEQLRTRIAELEAAAAWIPVGERLPEKTGRYEVLTFWLEVAIGDFVLGGYAPWNYQGVTHWRELPAPPEAK